MVPDVPAIYSSQKGFHNKHRDTTSSHQAHKINQDGPESKNKMSPGENSI